MIRDKTVWAALFILSLPSISLTSQAQESSAAPGTARIVHAAQAKIISGQEIPIAATLNPPGGATSAKIFFRALGETTYSAIELTLSMGTLSGAIPSYVTSESNRGVEYYIEALDPTGQTLASSGEAATPHLVTLERAFHTPEQVEVSLGLPFYKRWWFWAIVGAVAAGGAITAIALTTEQEETNMGVTLIINGPPLLNPGQR